MSKRNKIYNKLSEYDSDNLPIDDKNFITKLFGARLIGAMDNNLKESFQKLDRLSTLNEEQKLEIKEILKDNSKGFLYSMLLKLRDFSYPVEVNFLNPNLDNPEDEKLFSLEDELEFHFHYFDWIEEFSDYVNEA